MSRKMSKSLKPYFILRTSKLVAVSFICHNLLGLWGKKIKLGPFQAREFHRWPIHEASWYRLNQYIKINSLNNERNWHLSISYWKRNNITDTALLLELQLDPNWGTLHKATGLSSLKMSLSLKTKETEEVLQVKGNWRDITMKCDVWPKLDLESGKECCYKKH